VNIWTFFFLHGEEACKKKYIYIYNFFKGKVCKKLNIYIYIYIYIGRERNLKNMEKKHAKRNIYIHFYQTVILNSNMMAIEKLHPEDMLWTFQLI